MRPLAALALAAVLAGCVTVSVDGDVAAPTGTDATARGTVDIPTFADPDDGPTTRGQDPGEDRDEDLDPSGADASDVRGPGVPEDAWLAAVDHVIDGDTLWVVSLGGPGAPPTGSEVKVRLLRIDTPELSRDGQPAECLAEAARAHLEDLLSYDEPIRLAWDVEAQDQYGRDLLHAWDEDGTWVNGAMLADGYARVVTFPPNVAYDEEVRAAEQAARDAGRGLWSAC